MLKLHVLIASTRPGRVGLPVANWFLEIARTDARFDLTTIDLKELKLPPLDEPNHPRLRRYTREHTKAWSATVDAADAFVFVTPEYNYSSPPALVNALDYLHQEWGYKPVGFVSYGGVSGGTRSVQATKQIVTALRMVPIVEAVNIPFVEKVLDREAVTVSPGEVQAKAATAMLTELLRWAEALRPMRHGG
jgi:NAD(P)H-dependent FMN reductase